VIRALRAYPTLLRIGLAEAVAYRAEFLVWMLTTTMPLVNLALFSAIEASTGPIGRFGQPQLTSYFLGTLIVRQLTGTWVVWEMNQEIRGGTLSMRLLRPIHPIISYSAEHLAAVPLRAAVALPIAVVVLVASDAVVKDPLQAALLPLTIVGAWLMMFSTMFMIGTLGLFMERSVSVFEVWWGLLAVLSGYLFPLEMVPWLQDIANWLPFRYMVGYPVEVGIGLTSRAEMLQGLAVQWFWAGLAVLGALAVWRAGVKRFEAYGS
jgi:ABC-2 type transport system permease protein